MAEIPDGSIIVTPMMMYTSLNAVVKKVEHLETLLDPAFADIRKELADHEVRMRGLEKKIWLFSGFAAAISTLASKYLGL